MGRYPTTSEGRTQPVQPLDNQATTPQGGRGSLLRGGAGGSASTRRKRGEKNLMGALQALLTDWEVKPQQPAAEADSADLGVYEGKGVGYEMGAE